MKYTFVVIFFASSICNIQASAQPVTPEVRVEREEDQIFFDIDKMQEEMIENNVIEELDTRPPLPPRVMVWLRIIGLPLINAFVTVRKAIRDTWHRVAAAVVIKTKKKYEKKSA